MELARKTDYLIYIPYLINLHSFCMICFRLLAIGKTANCEPCQKNQIGDENHYIFECTNFSEKRKSLLPKHVIKHSNIIE
jgi:hypothetical protein